ncbi:MAG TPA: alpha/beta fold hydrolase [Pseudonocardiaceae bacterium]|nr:alpha/beta fold hydrolase [Pseudonocardiaceae bacterium]
MTSTPDRRVPRHPLGEDQPAEGPRHSRRSLLRAGVLGGSAAAAMAVSGTATAAPAVAATAPATPALLQNLFTQPDLDFETLFAFGGAGYGCAEFGELATAVDQINGTTGASYQAYYDAFLALAQRVNALADQELAAGHAVSARGAYLRASTYYDLCLYFILGTSARAQEAAGYANVQRCWQGAVRLFDPPFEPVRIPYGASWLPGYLLRPDDRPVRRPTIILNNGQDAQNIALYAMGGADAVARGYNALIFEGPGQGSMLFERRVPLRPDWENVITPVVDYLRSRRDVDPARIVLNGSSLGGGLVLRAAAFEHRLAAVVADPAIHSLWLCWQNGYQTITSLFDNGATRDQVNAAWQQLVPHLDAGTRFNLAKVSEPYGRQFLLAARSGQVLTDLYDLGTTLMKFTVAGVLDRITTPTLVTAYDNDQLVRPLSGQGDAVYDQLRCAKSRHRFTAAEGADQHCAPMAPQIRNQAVYDWIDGILEGRHQR